MLRWALPQVTCCVDFNQRTRYGVLLYRFVKKYPDWHLQPTHPVCGASKPKNTPHGFVHPSTNAPSMGCFLDTMLLMLVGMAFNQRTQYGVLQVFNWLLCGLRLPSTNAPSMGCFARRKKIVFSCGTFNQRILYGVLQSAGFIEIVYSVFNQRILYGVLRLLLFCNFARYTFNQRTQYGVLPKSYP